MARRGQKDGEKVESWSEREDQQGGGRTWTAGELGVRETGGKVCKQAARADKGGFTWQARQKRAGALKGGGENLCLCDQTTQKLERHKLIKMHSVPPPHTGYPSLIPLSLSLILPFLTLPPSITSLPPSHAGGGGP